MNVIRDTTAGGNIGQAFGTGLGSGLQMLAQNKLNQIQQQQQTHKGAQFWKGLGLSDEVAYQFANAPESVQKSLLDRLEGVNIGGQPQTSQPGQAAQPSTGVTIGANPAERRHKETLEQQERLSKEKLEFKKQELIDKQNEPFNKRIDERLPIAEEASSLIDNIVKNLDTGKVATNWSGAIQAKIGSPSQNKETQEFIADVNKLVILETLSGKGLPSKFRLLLEQAAKASTGQRPEVQRGIINRMKTKVNKYLVEAKVRDDLIEANGGNQPKDLSYKVRKALKSYDEQPKQEAQKLAIGSTIDTSSMDKKSIPVGALGNDENGNLVKWDGNDWVKA